MRYGRESDFERVKQQAAELLKALDRGEVASLYVFAGADEFQRHTIVRRVLAKLVPESQRDTSLTVLDGQSTSAREIAAELESPGFRFDDDPRRVVYVRDVPFFTGGKSEDVEPLRQRLSGPLWDDVTLVLEVRGALDRRLNLTKAVLEVGTCLEFPLLSGPDDIEEFLRARLRRLNKSITRAAVEELTARRGNDTQVLCHEVDKLACYLGERQEIEVDHVRQMVAPTAELSVFDLVDAVAERKPKAALEQLEGLLAQQAEPFMILAMLIRQFRLLLQACYLLESELVDARSLQQKPYQFNQDLTSKQSGQSRLERWQAATAEIFPTDGKQSLLKQHYFPLWKTLKQAQRLRSKSVEAALERLLQADLALKSSHLPPRQEVELLVVDLCCRLDSGVTVAFETILDL